MKPQLKKTIQLHVSLSFDEKIVSDTKIISLEGDLVTLTTDILAIDITPTIPKKDQVFMQFVVSKIQDENKIILSKPQMTSWIDQSATIMLEDTKIFPQSITLTVTPTYK